MTERVARVDRLHISYSEVEALAREVGHAFYLIDLNRIQDNYNALLHAFRKRYADTVLAYSVKTNYTPCILSHLRELGARAEVVSELEYEMALRAGYREDDILVSGPLHEEAFLKHIFLQGVHINLDGWYMLETLDRVSRAYPERRFRVGIRLSYALPDTDWTRFGFDTSEAEISRLNNWFQHHGNCELVGLHSHFPLAPSHPEFFRERITGLIQAGSQFPDARLEYLDLGGGMHRSTSDALFDNLADTVAHVLETHDHRGKRPTLFIEPGHAIVDDAIAFVCRVYDVKQRAGRTLALINGSNHSINTMMWHDQFKIDLLRASGVENQPPSGEVFSIVGNTCMERKDLICESIPGLAAPGDYIVFSHVGAYSNVIKPPFIHTCPAMLARRDGQYKVVKRPETVDDILQTYHESVMTPSAPTLS
ncbi:alanine racemase [Candidatus Entotheonella palauensis]|uniref:alanine racemase n=1 Tax=Candidatus Entotheonella palauensis TaxID=93172 RepID=UPI0015C4C6F9|nr:alanine racemase [Candidatus Entotheonella palauensis]